MMIKPSSRRIALDVDGVLLDYCTAYAGAWFRAFGEKPSVVNPNAYYSHTRLGVPWLSGEPLRHLVQHFDEHFWSTMPALPGAVQATRDLADAGWELICVSALPVEWAEARLYNLRAEGMPITRVIARPQTDPDVNPKAVALEELQPAAFVDDCLPFFRDVPHTIHQALILRDPEGSPNVGEGLNRVHSTHTDLANFTRWWLAQTTR